MTKKCCNVTFTTFTPDTNYSSLECLTMNLISMASTKNPRKSGAAIKILRKQAKTLYDCCNSPAKLNHSFGELKEHVLYLNRYNIINAKKAWTKPKEKKKK